MNHYSDETRNDCSVGGPLISKESHWKKRKSGFQELASVVEVLLPQTFGLGESETGSIVGHFLSLLDDRLPQILCMLLLT